MADQTQTETQKESQQDQTSNPQKQSQQRFDAGHDRGAEKLTNALNPIQPKRVGQDAIDQPNADPKDAQKRQAERGGS